MTLKERLAKMGKLLRIIDRDFCPACERKFRCASDKQRGTKHRIIHEALERFVVAVEAADDIVAI